MAACDDKFNSRRDRIGICATFAKESLLDVPVTILEVPFFQYIKYSVLGEKLYSELDCKVSFH